MLFFLLFVTHRIIGITSLDFTDTREIKSTVSLLIMDIFFSIVPTVIRMCGCQLFIMSIISTTAAFWYFKLASMCHIIALHSIHIIIIITLNDP